MYFDREDTEARRYARLISEVHHFVYSRNLDLPVGAIAARLFEALEQGERRRLALKAYMLAGAKTSI